MYSKHTCGWRTQFFKNISTQRKFFITATHEKTISVVINRRLTLTQVKIYVVIRRKILGSA